MNDKFHMPAAGDGCCSYHQEPEIYCGANWEEGIECPVEAAERAEWAAFFRSNPNPALDPRRPTERDTEAYNADLREAGRGHLIRETP